MIIKVLDHEATGKRIKELRSQHNMKVEELASLMGLESVQAIYKWQRSESMPTLDNLVILAGLFGTTIDDIVVNKEIEESESSLHCYMAVF